MGGVDEIALRFDARSLTVLNVILALLMFGVALGMKTADFKRVVTHARAVWIGLAAQFLLLPAFTFLLVTTLKPIPSMALGMILVAACPGGNLSNFMTFLARGNTALSVTMSAVSTCAAIVLMPGNLAFWGSLHPETRGILRQVALSPLDMMLTVATILGVPIVLGMTLAARYPEPAARLQRAMRPLSIIVFLIFVGAALAANYDYFLKFVGRVAGLVALHNAVALSLGYLAARLAALQEIDRRAVAIEVGIQNSGLGLLIIFNFFDGLGGMAIVAAWWGVWHILSGLAVSSFWGRRVPVGGEAVG